MKECEFEYNEHRGVYRCMVCGREIKAPKDSIVSAYCKIQTADAEPSLIKKAAHYAVAVVQHYTTGAKIREDAEVKVILEICKSCPYYNSDNQTCRKCGCRCNSSRNPLVNKIRMESQHCPTGQW